MPSTPTTDILRATLDVFDAVPTGTPLTTTEVADHLEVGRRSAYDRLDRLVARGSVLTKKVGAKGRVWWRPPVGHTAPPGSATEQAVRRERDFLAGVLEASPTGIGIFDDAGQPLRVNRRFVELLGRAADEPEGYVLGEQELLEEDGETIPFPERPAPVALSTGEPVVDRRIRVDGPDGRTRWLSVNVEPLDGDTDGVVATMGDVTQLHEQARRLQRRRDELTGELSEVFERFDDAVFALDGDRRFTYVNERAASRLDRPASELIGEPVAEALPEAVGTVFQAEAGRALATGASVTFETAYPPLDAWFEVCVSPTERGLSCSLRDVTERKARECELERQWSIVEALGDGLYVLDEDHRFVQVNEAYAAMTGYDREALLGAPCSLVVGEAVSRRAAARAEALAADGGQARFEADLRRADGDTLRAECTIAALTEPDGTFAGAVGVVRDVADRTAHEQALERQQEHLSAIDDLNGVFRDVIHAAVDQSSRAEIEAIVCECLAASASYQCAWIGELDDATGTVRHRKAASSAGAFDGDSVPTTRDDVGLEGRALNEGTLQVAQDINAGTVDDEAWRALVRNHRIRSSAAIPIAFDGRRYGVLTVCADRPRGFTADERAVVGQLGEVIGHAIAAVERKRALMTDEVVELEFRLPDVFSAVEDVAATDGRVTFERTVPAGEGSLLVYGTATGRALEAVEAIVASPDVDYWTSLTVLEADERGTRFELGVTEPPVLSTVAAYGGDVRATRIEDGAYVTRVHLAAGADVRQVVEEIEAVHPTIELRRQRQVTRDESSLTRVRGTLLGALTERQRSAIEAAYFTGYFSWPRGSTGEDVAASLGVSSPTFHRHLRKAQASLLSGLLDEGLTAG